MASGGNGAGAAAAAGAGLKAAVKGEKTDISLVMKYVRDGVRLQGLREALLQLIAGYERPLTRAAYVLEECPGYGRCKPKSIVFVLMQELVAWKKKVGAAAAVTAEDRAVGMKLALGQQNVDFLLMAVEVYELNREDFALPIKRFIAEHKYVLAQQLVVGLDMCDFVEIEELILPLILQNKMYLAEEILRKRPSQAALLVSHLDGLLSSARNAKPVRNLPNVQSETLQDRSLGKMIVKLSKKFNVDIEIAKNLNRQRKYGFLKYIIAKKYKGDEMGEEAWRDLILDTVGDSEEVKRVCVKFMARFDLNEATAWAYDFDLPPNILPPLRDVPRRDDFDSALPRPYNGFRPDPYRNDTHYSVSPRNYNFYPPNMYQNYNGYPQGPSQHRNFNSGGISERNVPSSSSTSTSYYILYLPESEIYLVDTEQKFSSVLHGNLSMKKLVGIDCEWKPSFDTKNSKISLLQIATSSAVYLFDVLALSTPRCFDLWKLFAEKVFENTEVVKLGFGIKNDLKEIKSSIPGYSNLKINDVGYLELHSLWKHFLSTGIHIPYRNDDLGEKLTSITEQCFGKSLDKREQCSNWENRPLRMSQLNYAALDAYVLLDIYYFIRRIYFENNLDFDNICSKIMNAHYSPESKKYKGKNKNPANFQTPKKPEIIKIQNRSTSNFKFVVDNSLQTLSHCLRYCGIDTLLWGNISNNPYELIQFIKYNCRTLITSGKMDNKIFLKQNLADNMVCFLSSTSVEDQLNELLDHFKIRISTENLFKRCVICNFDVIHSLNSDSMKKLAVKDCDLTKDLLLYTKTTFGNPIHLNKLTDAVLENNSTFFICQNCGNIFWDKSELSDSLCDTVQNIICKYN